MDYDETFSRRGHMYKYATETYPGALSTELQTAVRVCALKPGDTLLNVPAACVNLEPYLPPDVNYVRYETNKPFADMTGIPHCSLFDIPMADNSVDVILSLASLHHATDEERDAFYAEAMRILKPGGRLIIGDVLRGSAQDSWLNTFVNMYNSAGHQGKFWSAEDTELLDYHGFHTRVSIHTYTWPFLSESDMLDFCKHLFGLDLATEAKIRSGIQQFLSPRREQDGIHIPWQLIYFTSTNAHTHAPTS